MHSKNISTGCGKDMPPKIKLVKIYFDQKGHAEEAANEFFQHYKCRKWKTKRGCPVKDWKAAANNWIWQNRPQKPISIEIKFKLDLPQNTQF
jgi:hypothetical protein